MATIFSVAEARAFDKQQLADAGAYPDLVITAKAEEITEWFARACGVDFVSTSHANELHDGDDSDYLILDWPEVTAVTAIVVDGVALTAGEISPTDYSEGLAIDAKRGIITRRAGIFSSGWANVDVTYTAGFATTPDLIKRAALMVCVTELPATNIPFGVDDAEIGGMSYSFGRGDGYNGNWHRIPDVQKAIRMYDYHVPGIA